MLTDESTSANLNDEPWLKSVPLREHIAQAASLGAMILGLTVGKWWSGTKFGKVFKKARVSLVYNIRRAFAEKTASELPRRSLWQEGGGPRPRPLNRFNVYSLDCRTFRTGGTHVLYDTVVRHWW